MSPDRINEIRSGDGVRRAGFAFAILLFVLIGLVSYRSIHILVDNAQLLDHTHIVVGKAEQLVSTSYEAWSAQRETADADAAATLVRTTFADLRGLTADNLAQQRRLDSLAPIVSDRLADLATLRAAYVANPTAPIDPGLVKRGQIGMDHIRAAAAEIVTEENRLYGARNAAVTQRVRFTLFALVIGIGIGVATLYAVFVWMNREVRRRRNAEGMLQAANAGLEARVHERTAEFETANEELLRTRRFLDLVIENMPGMVFAKDTKDLKFILVNRAGEKLLGYRREEVIGKTSYDFAPKERADVQTARHREIIASGKLDVVQKGDLHNRFGEKRMVQTKMIPVADKDGNPEFLLGLCEDITERESLEQQLRQAQKMESIGQLTGGVAHDFNNLLGIITANVDLLLERLDSDPESAELAQEALDGAARGAELTQRMLAFARKQPLQPKTIDLNEALPGMTGMLRRTVREDIAVEMAPAEGLWTAFCDKSQIEDVILNLAINARDAMPDGGRLLIETANVHLDAAYAAQHVEVAAGDYVMLAVTDSGTGMTQEVIERAFEPFFTTKGTGRGSGLGLSMVYGFAKQSGGHVKLYSEVGHGTTVKLYLPRAAGDAGETSRPDARIGKALRAAGDETILVVEDDERLRRVAVKLLRELGYAVHEADTAQHALDILESGISVNLLFTDVVMPGGMTGVDLAVALRERRPDLKVLLTTGYSEIFVKNGNGHEDMELISKPYLRRDLAAKIRAILDGVS